MAVVFKRGQLFIPLLVQCRHRINIRRPRPGPLDRRIFEAVTQPIVIEKLVVPYEDCSVLRDVDKKKEEVAQNEYEQYLVRQCRKVFEENSMLVALQSFSLKGRVFQKIRIQLLRKGIQVQEWYPNITREAIINSKWRNLEPLLAGKTMWVSCPEPRVADLISIVKKIPELAILGGVVENRIMSYASLVQYSKLPPLDHLLGELVSVLNAGPSKILSRTGHHQQTLSYNLKQYIKDQSLSECESSSETHVSPDS